MGTNDLVSIIIPCYNQAQYLEEAVQSAVNQTYPNIEIIIVNDGSPDNTEDIAQSLEAKYPETIRVISQKNSGVSKARNSGIKEASGQYILPLDADDKLHEKIISRCVEAMQQTNADIVHGGLQCFGERDDVWMSRPFSENNILYRNLPHGSSLYKKAVWEKINGYKQNMKEGYEDWEFWINAYKHNFVFHYIPEVLFYYRIKKVSRDTLAIKKDIYLKAKIMMNHPELYTVDQVQEAIETIKNTEKLADLYFYHDKNIPKNEKKWLTEIGKNIKHKTLEEKQVLEVFNEKLGLCNIDIFKENLPIEKLYDEMNVSYILFFAPMRYAITGLYNSVFAWSNHKGIVNAQGNIFPFVSESSKENTEQQLIAYKRLVKFQNMQHEEKIHMIQLLKGELKHINSKIYTLQNAIEKLIKVPMIKQPIKKFKAYINFVSIYESLNPIIIEDDKHILFTVKPKMKNVQVAFYLLKNNERIDTKWYSEDLSYKLDKNKYGKGKYRIHYFVIDKNKKDPGKAEKQEIGYSDYIEIT